jgi:hypothetical protein
MAITNTFTRYAAVGLREQLTDAIYDISPEDTPFVSGSGKLKATQTLFEWQTDSLADATSANAHVEGADITSFPVTSPTVRVGNYTQISRKLLILSGTLEVVDKAGRKSEEAYQLAKRGRELKRDMETICLANLGGNAGGEATARQTASILAFIKSNVNKAANGANPVYTSGVPSAARTDGTAADLRAFSETILKDVAQQVYISGGRMHTLLVPPAQKTVASGFTGVVTRNYDISNRPAKPTAVIAAVDVYVTDWGTLQIVPDRFMRSRDALLWDPEYTAIAHLRPFQRVRLAKTGDAEKSMLLVEWGLQVKQEAALGLAADLSS